MDQKVLFVSDDPRDQAHAEDLRHLGFEVVVVTTAHEFVDAVYIESPDVAVIQHLLIDGLGTEYIKRLQTANGNSCHRFVLLVEQDYTGEEHGIAWDSSGEDFELLRRPFGTDELIKAMTRAKPPRLLSA
jgi:DNA-binding response OmpR family regulator